MNDPERLAEQMEDPVGRAALRAMRGDAASDEARQKTLLALGLGGGLAVGGGAASAAGQAAKAASQAAAPFLVKWVAGGAAVVALALGGSAYLAPADDPAPVAGSVRAPVPSSHRAPPSIAAAAEPAPVVSSPTPASVAPSRASDARPVSMPVQAAADRPGSMDVMNTPPASPAGAGASEERGAPAPAGSAAEGRTPAANVAASVREELAAIDQVRRLLAARDGAGALRSLDAYQAAFPRGVLGIEATMLRIEALVASGQASAARDLATRFIAAHPSNPLVPRVRSLVGMTPETVETNP